MSIGSLIHFIVASFIAANSPAQHESTHQDIDVLARAAAASGLVEAYAEVMDLDSTAKMNAETAANLLEQIEDQIAYNYRMTEYFNDLIRAGAKYETCSNPNSPTPEQLDPFFNDLSDLHDAGVENLSAYYSNSSSPKVPTNDEFSALLQLASRASDELESENEIWGELLYHLKDCPEK